MATYVLGDIHGCFETLERLLLAIPFEARQDRLWLTGDLVNRGQAGLEVLRWAEAAQRTLGDRFVAVLGNHDLHLLSTAAGVGRPHHRESFDPILTAPDGDVLLEWLARRPLLHREGSTALVHAGLLPEWSIEEAQFEARTIEGVLRHKANRQEFLESIARANRLPRELYGLTALRLLDVDGEPSDFNGPPESAPEGCVPWFEVAGRRSRENLVVAGHWSALGLRLDANFIGLDTGCVYGGSLTAIRLEDRKVYSVANAEPTASRSG